MGVAMRSLILGLALALVVLSQGHAEIRILSSSGGAVGPYLNFYAQLRRSGERVVIDGPCLSACTLVLSTIPRNRICVTRRAVLGFHAPFLIDRSGHSFHSQTMTKAVAASYPAAVRSWINHKGGLKSGLIYLKGRELAALYPRC
jgi:hypothetical protein